MDRTTVHQTRKEITWIFKKTKPKNCERITASRLVSLCWHQTAAEISSFPKTILNHATLRQCNRITLQDSAEVTRPSFAVSDEPGSRLSVILMLSILITEATKVKSTVILKVPEPRAKTWWRWGPWNQMEPETKPVPCSFCVFWLKELHAITIFLVVQPRHLEADLNRRTGEFHRPLDIFELWSEEKILFGTNKSFLSARTEAASQCKCWVKTNVHIDEVLDHRCRVRLKTTAA